MMDLSHEVARLRQRRIERRSVMKTAAVGAAAASVGSVGLARTASAQTAPTSDIAVFQFALNLEYLEAEYYLRGVTGQGLTSDQITGPIGTAGATVAPSTTLVPFQTAALAYYFIDIASEENAHVNFIRAALSGYGALIAKPAIDLETSFNTLAQAAGLGSTFNPFESELNFLIGSYIFEDVGVTAYAGAASALTVPANLTYAANILATEAYHSGAIRGFLSEIGAGDVTDAISQVRTTLSQAINPSAGVDDYGTNAQGNAFNFASSDVNAIAFRRTPQQVLNIVYGGASPTGGLFFPNGVNGTITTTT